MINTMHTTAARPPVSAWVGLGANLGDARASVLAAIEALGRLPRTQLPRASSLYRSAPWQAEGADFINAVAQVQTGLSAPDLLRALQALERAAALKPLVATVSLRKR